MQGNHSIEKGRQADLEKVRGRQADLEKVRARRRFIKRVGLAGVAALVLQGCTDSGGGGGQRVARREDDDPVRDLPPDEQPQDVATDEPVDPLNPWDDQVDDAPPGPGLGDPEPGQTLPPIDHTEPGIETGGGGAVGAGNLSGLSGASGAARHLA